MPNRSHRFRILDIASGRIGILGAMLWVASMHTVVAQSADSNERPNDEVVVTAPKPTTRLLNEIGKATEYFYKRWNEWIEGYVRKDPALRATVEALTSLKAEYERRITAKHPENADD